MDPIRFCIKKDSPAELDKEVGRLKLRKSSIGSNDRVLELNGHSLLYFDGDNRCILLHRSALNATEVTLKIDEKETI